MFSKVERFSTGIDRPNSREHFGKMRQVDEHNRQVDLIQKQNDQARVVNESTQATRAYTEGTLNQRDLARAQRVAIERIHKDAPEMILREAMHRIYTKALCLDTDFVTENTEIFRFMAHMYTHRSGGIANLKARMESTKSPFLASLYKTCMESGKKLADKKIEKIKKATNKDEAIIDFSVDEETAEDLFADIDKLTVDEIADLVKEKVIKVIQDETDKDDNEEDLASELKEVRSDAEGDAEAGDDDTDPEDDETGVEESFNIRNRYAKVVKESSLFVAIMTGCYKEKMGVLKEANDPLKQSVINNPLNLNVYDIYLQDSNNALGFVDFVKNLDTPDVAGDQTNIDNDEILAEAVAQYTLLECFNTVKLIDITYEDTQQMIRYYKNA